VAPPRNRNWIWFFVVLGVLSVAAIGLLRYARWRFGQLQLTPERLEQARRLWEEKGPKDYELVYRKQIQDREPEQVVVRVERGRPTSVSLNGRELPADKRTYYTMEGIFNDLWDFQKIDEKAKGKATTWVQFDAEDGHVSRYGHRNAEGHGAVEVTVEGLRPR
jgi:hypothetical protein